MNDLMDKNYTEAQKFLGLMEAFDTSVDGLEENLVNYKKDIIKDLEVIDKVPEELNMSLIESDELLGDFVLVRESLREDIKSTRMLLKKLSDDIAVMDSEEMNPEILSSFAELKKGNVTSMKLLMDSYSTVAETQLKIKKLVHEIKKIEEKASGDTTNVQNNFMIGTTADILKSIRG